MLSHSHTPPPSGTAAATLRRSRSQLASAHSPISAAPAIHTQARTAAMDCACPAGGAASRKRLSR